MMIFVGTHEEYLSNINDDVRDILAIYEEEVNDEQPMKRIQQ